MDVPRLTKNNWHPAQHVPSRRPFGPVGPACRSSRPLWNARSAPFGNMKQLQAQLLKRRSEIQDGQANTALQSFTPGERMTSKDGVNHIESWVELDTKLEETRWLEVKLAFDKLTGEICATRVALEKKMDEGRDVLLKKMDENRAVLEGKLDGHKAALEAVQKAQDATRSYVRLYIMLLVVLLVVVTGSNPLVAAAITHLSSLLKSWMWA